MLINFPDTPVVDQTFTSGDKTWKWTGTRWEIVVVNPLLLTDYYTSQQVDQAVLDLVGAAPEALNTLSELATALNDDASFATTITNAIATKANSDSPTITDPTFTGTVTLPSTTSIGNVSATEIGYVDGVTSNIQTQLNSKASTTAPTLSNPSFTGTAYLGGNLQVNSSSNLIAYQPTTTSVFTPYNTTVYGTVMMGLSPWAINITIDDGMGYIPGILSPGDQIDFIGMSVVNPAGPLMITSVGPGMPNGVSIMATTTSPTVISNWENAQNQTWYPMDIMKISNSAVTISSLELSYLDGITSNVQTQLNAAVASSTYVTMDQTLSKGKYFVDTASSKTLTLPASPTMGDEIQIFDATGTAGTNIITVANNGNKINGVLDSASLDVNGVAAVFVWTGSTYGWRMG